MNAPAVPRAGGRSSRPRDAAGASPYLLGSHGRPADCRDRAPAAACASRRRCRDSGAAPWRCDRVSDARGQQGRGRSAYDAGRARTVAASPGAGVAAARAPAGFQGRSAPCRSSRAAVPRLVSAVRVRQGKCWVGEGRHARAAQPADRSARSVPRRPSAAAARASFRWPRSERRLGSSSPRRRSRTEGSLRIGCGLRSGKRAAGGW